MQTQVPAMQREGASHSGSQPQVSTQVPFWQISPRSQVTPKQGLARHAPARQNSPSSQVMPSQAERGVQVRWHAPSSPQPAAHGSMSAQVPRDGSQYWPSGHETPSHATGRQPGKQVPATQVSSAAQRTSAHGSTSATQIARQRSSPSQGLSVAQGSS